MTVRKLTREQWAEEARRAGRVEYVLRLPEDTAEERWHVWYVANRPPLNITSDTKAAFHVGWALGSARLAP